MVAAGQGALFPVAPFNLTVWPTAVQPLSTNAEIVRVTARTSDTLTITRAQEGTTARTIVVGYQVANAITAKVLTDVEQMPPPPPVQSIVLFGDSITSQNDVAIGGEPPQFHSLGYWTWANIRLGQRFELLKNAGVSSETTTLMLARIQTDVIAYNPGYCFVQPSGNDFATLTAEQSITNLTAIYDTLLAKRIVVIAATLLPGSSITGGNQAKAGQINKAIRNYARTRSGVIYLPWSMAVANSDATGGPATGMYYDAVHPDNLGAMRLGRVVADALSTATYASDLMPFFNDTYEGLLADPFLNLSQAIDRYNGAFAQPTYTYSAVARTDGLQGTWRQFAVTAAPGGWRWRTDDLNVGTKWNVGDTIYAVAEFQVDAGVVNADAAMRFFAHLELITMDAGANYLAVSTSPRVGQGTATTDVCNGVFRTKNIVIPATTTRLRLEFRSGYTGTFRIGRLQIYKV